MIHSRTLTKIMYSTGPKNTFYLHFFKGLVLIIQNIISAMTESESKKLACPAIPEGMHFGTTWGPPATYSQFQEVSQDSHLLFFTCFEFLFVSFSYHSMFKICSSKFCHSEFLTEMLEWLSVSIKMYEMYL